MLYFLTIYSSHGLVRSSWNPGGSLIVHVAADDSPAASLSGLVEQDTDNAEAIWSAMLSATLEWLLLDSPEVEIHGYSVGRRQPWSLDRFLNAKKAS